MSGLSRLYRGETDIDFPKLFKPMVILSFVLVIVSLASLFFRGLNLSIDFDGGAVWEVPSEELTVEQASEVLAGFDLQQGAKVQEARSPDGTRILRVQADTKEVAVSQKVAAVFAEKVDVKLEEVGTNTVGPSWGSEITKQALYSLIVFFIVIALYMSWQLEWRMAVSAIVAVIHDIIITVGVYSLLRFEVTPATVISFLTILGYSLYDTIVVYDRVRENTARYDRSERYTYRAIMRRSLNQVLMRSTNTTLVAILPVLSLLTIGAIGFDQPTLRDFSIALLVGLIAGAYSSIFIAAPVVVALKEREPRYLRIRQKARDRGAEAAADHMPLDIAQHAPIPVAVGAMSSAGDAPATVTSKAAQYQRPHPPRPRKQGRTK